MSITPKEMKTTLIIEQWFDEQHIDSFDNPTHIPRKGERVYLSKNNKEIRGNVERVVHKFSTSFNSDKGVHVQELNIHVGIQIDKGAI